MPSSLLLMSGTLPTEVFKILPVVHSRVHVGGGEGGHVCKNDGQQLLKKIFKWITKDNSSIRSISRFSGGRTTSRRI